MLTFQLALKRSSTLELEDVQEDVSDDIDMGELQVSEVHFALIISFDDDDDDDDDDEEEEEDDDNNNNNSEYNEKNNSKQ